MLHHSIQVSCLNICQDWLIINHHQFMGSLVFHLALFLREVDILSCCFTGDFERVGISNDIWSKRMPVSPFCYDHIKLWYHQ
jgi:hypothetical protein